MNLRCPVCPHGCSLKEGQTGLCRVRTASGGKVIDAAWGRISGLSMDPVEKKPLYHYYPGSAILSVGFYGCSFRCPFCQNHSISQNPGPPAGRGEKILTPEALVDLALENRSFGIAYTYSEPLVHLEYLLEACRLARRKGLKNVLISNGFINPEPAQELIPLLDAANIDLKSFNPDFYRRELKGELEPVLDFFRRAAGRIHLEATTLIIPGKNDSEEEMDALSGFLAGLDESIPLHLSAYYPQYRYTLPPTPPETVLELVKIARRNLRYVYPGNLSGGDSDTRCRDCGALMVSRRGYRIESRLTEGGNCPSCGAAGPVVVK